MGAGQSSGFVIWHRTVFASWLWRLPPAQFKVAFALVAFANWTPEQWHDGRSPVEIPRGEFVTSQANLAKECGVSVKVVRVSLGKLVRANMIEVDAGRASMFTRIRLVNYGAYQDLPRVKGEQRASEGRVKGEQRASEGRQVNKGTREQGNKGTNNNPQNPPKGDVEIVVEYLNAQLGRTGAACFRARGKTRELIEARMADGALVRDLRMVCWHRVREWKDDEQMAKFLRPSTLFRRSKFEEYLPQAAAAVAEQKPETTDPHKVSREDYKPLLGGLR
ncbi:hypothetical protein LCGC14_0678450 [marine sediment metagenome]|uniref:Phage conserved hypothetical protein C-terminal domain-containing protein n=2 Tax=root TaxID=1 RepID=A0A9C9NJC2_9HYPH|nr:hypothetical protein [Aurantimonas coralicida]